MEVPGQPRAVPFTKALHRMLTEIPEHIRLEAGSLIIPSPRELEPLLSRFFRHSRYASFQRQLNNFGFHRQTGSGTTIYRREGSPDCVEDVDAVLKLRHALRRPAAESADSSPASEGRKPAKKPRRAPSPTRRAPSPTSAAFDASAVTALLDLKHTFRRNSLVNLVGAA